jgi:hypothetical protein
MGRHNSEIIIVRKVIYLTEFEVDHEHFQLKDMRWIKPSIPSTCVRDVTPSR